ncbi:MAG: ribonuclease HII [Methylocystaceae bacterium]|nr:ribonuclease HII [Methylocystaceae bacterium]NBV94716.1 ribonuclease HII [Methylocystaceae bacterium]
MLWPDFQQETTLLREGFSPVVGVDEVGRGPLAGPVTAAAVILNPKNLPLGVADSKALNAKHRDAAFESIIERARAISISFVTAAEIDRINIRQASLLAMKRAIDGLSLKPGFALIDGRDCPELDCPARAIIKGDATVLSIAAASIVAKVARDGMMRRLALLYPDYGFETNVGYGAKRHLEALERLGPTPFHRFSFAPLRERSGTQRQK